MTDSVNALKKWTGKVSATIVYDSTVDEFTDDGLFNKVRGKRNIAVIGFTTDGDVFGGFYSVAVTKQDQRFYDPSIFAFSFESHGRCVTPKRFCVKEGWKGRTGVKFYISESYGRFVVFDCCGGGFSLGYEKSSTWSDDLWVCFDGIEDTTLTGKPDYEDLICCRLVAVQLH